VRAPATLLPPDRLLPFMVPFHGGPGPLCGGAASGGAARMAADLGSFVGLGDGGGGGGGPLAPSPFRLPPAYEDAKERKVAAVAELRNAVKAVRPRAHTGPYTRPHPAPGLEIELTRAFV